MNLDEELKAAGCEMDPGDFRERLADWYAECHRDCPDEQWIRDYTAAVAFVKLVQQKARMRRATFEHAWAIVVATIQNMRKRSGMPTVEAA